MNFVYKSIYNRLFKQVIHKEGQPATKNIKIFHNSKALEILLGNSYSNDKLMHAFLDNF